MKLLLDANLSWRLIKELAETFPDCKHVDKIGLSIPAKDIEIWNWAKKEKHAIITNDEDFLKLVIQKNYPPKIILLRTGNQSTKNIKEILIKNKLKIHNLIESPHVGILEIY